MNSKENLDKIIKNDFIVLAYRDKYNLTFNDDKLLNGSEIEFFADLLITNHFKKFVNEKKEDDPLFDDEDEKMFSVQDGYSLEDWKSGKINKLHIGGFTKEEEDKFWNDDSIIDKELKVNKDERSS